MRTITYQKLRAQIVELIEQCIIQEPPEVAYLDFEAIKPIYPDIQVSRNALQSLFHKKRAFVCNKTALKTTVNIKRIKKIITELPQTVVFIEKDRREKFDHLLHGEDSLYLLEVDNLLPDSIRFEMDTKKRMEMMKREVLLLECFFMLANLCDLGIFSEDKSIHEVPALVLYNRFELRSNYKVNIEHENVLKLQKYLNLKNKSQFTEADNMLKRESHGTEPLFKLLYALKGEIDFDLERLYWMKRAFEEYVEYTELRTKQETEQFVYRVIAESLKLIVNADLKIAMSGGQFMRKEDAVFYLSCLDLVEKHQKFLHYIFSEEECRNLLEQAVCRRKLYKVET